MKEATILWNELFLPVGLAASFLFAATSIPAQGSGTAADDGLSGEKVAAIENAQIGALPPSYGGQKVLLRFRSFLGKRAEQNSALRSHVEKEIEQSLGEAGITVIHKVSGILVKRDPRYFEQMWLLDTRGREPRIMIGSLPYSGGGIVFQDGTYQDGLPIPNPERWEDQYRSKVPLPFGFWTWSAHEGVDGTRDRELIGLHDMPSVQVDYMPPRAGSGGSAGWVKLTPREGATLLEVFLLTGAGFCFEDPATSGSHSE